jgi:hypothetical protein
VWVDDPLPDEEDDFSGEEDDYPDGPGEFADGPRTYTGRHGARARGPADYANGVDDFAHGPADYADEPPSIGGSAALDYLDGSYTPPTRPSPSSGQPNGFAIAAFVLGVIGGTILSCVLAVIALRQIRETGQRGRWLAIAGIGFSAFWAVVLFVILFVYNPGSPANPAASAGSGSSPGSSSSSGPSPSAGQGGSSPAAGGSQSGAVTHPQNANVFALSADECFQNPPTSQAVLGITSVTAVPCTTPHNAQVFAQFAATATGTSYPGTAAIKHQADKGCHARLTGRVVSSKITNTMTLRFLFPLASSWGTGHRTISCLIVDAKPDLKSSLLRTQH